MLDSGVISARGSGGKRKGEATGTANCVSTGAGYK